MKMLVTLFLFMGLTVGGCAASGTEAPAAPDKDKEAAVAAAPQASAATPSPKATPAKQRNARSSKGKKTEAQIAAELDTVGRRLAAQASRTVMPNKSSKKVRSVGKEFVASYVEVDPQHVSTSMRPSTTGKGHYIGFVSYQERHMECRGATKKAALESTQCIQVKARGMKELIHYDGSSWKY